MRQKGFIWERAEYGGNGEEVSHVTEEKNQKSNKKNIKKKPVTEEEEHEKGGGVRNPPGRIKPIIA